MRNILRLLLMALVMLMLTASGPSYCKGIEQSPGSSFRVGKIDIAMAASLHPKMSLFDFQKMGFYRVAQGLSYEEYTRAIADLKSKKPEKSLEERLMAIESEMKSAGSAVREIINSQKTNNPQRMTQDSAGSYIKLQTRLAELTIEKEEVNFALKNPEFTSPKETREILQEIEDEILASIRFVARNDDYSLVLNTSVPAPFGYPVKYHFGSRFSTGPVGVDQTLLYGFLAEKRSDHEAVAETEDYLRKWISITGRPEVLDMLPMKPHPLVLEGGESILTKVLERIYNDHGVDREIFGQLEKILTKLDLK